VVNVMAGFKPRVIGRRDGSGVLWHWVTIVGNECFYFDSWSQAHEFVWLISDTEGHHRAEVQELLRRVGLGYNATHLHTVQRKEEG
jgi:hypothetical protein